MKSTKTGQFSSQHIEWAYGKCVEALPQVALTEAIPLICAEVMRTDEIGLITAGGKQVAIVYHAKKRQPGRLFEMMAIDDFPRLSWDHLFEFMGLPTSNSSPSKSVVSGFELLLYRPQAGQLYTPLKYTSYLEAAAASDRHLYFVVNVIYTASMGALSCLTQVEQSVLQAVFEKRLRVEEMTIVEAVDEWLKTVYTEAAAERRYAALSRFPLVQPPADSDDQAPVKTVQLDAADW
ncbi:hypothetical protein S7335_1269 [Synechococcus sp. PCC 7335]|uniref:hypothetical protein n=1 Tax=Synechococcus sp. (strain ATCC 29403 / PCC 7335) TaxID=91464 RepID=UPI00017EB91C|nr:hypothetical protein [Synechococcus sp. PCC 7335]EDX82565.1 hypothetical protein S7335_1269 [Synechococcus sp. PCC 7335]